VSPEAGATRSMAALDLDVEEQLKQQRETGRVQAASG
jgi:hypothetical protein